MSALQRHNGQLIALSLAAVCAVFIAFSVFGYDHAAFDENRVLVIAGLCAVVTTWVFWKLFVSRGRRMLVFRGAVAGALSGFFSIPLFLFAGAFAQASSECANVDCVFSEILVQDAMMELVVRSLVYSFFGYVVVGPLTISVGVLGGILAVVASGQARRSEDRPDLDDPHETGFDGDAHRRDF